MQQRLKTALADYRAGAIGAAARAYRVIVDEFPEQPDALHMLAIIAQHMNKLALALQLFDETLRVAPYFGQAWSNRAVLLRAMGDAQQALESAQKAIAIDPELADGWNIAGLLLREKKDYDAACEYQAKAVALDSRNAHFYSNYAVALIPLGRLGEAYRAVRQAETLEPGLFSIQMVAGNILSAAGYPARALAHFRNTYALNDRCLEAAVSEGRMLLMMGDFEQGWERMEKRDYDQARFARWPRWQGERTGRLLLYAEQGIGDIIHFIRYVSLIKDRARALTLQLPLALKKPLQRLIAANLPGLALAAPDFVSGADVHAPLMSLPHLCKTTLATIPSTVPYLRAEEEWCAAWRARLASVPRPRIGIVWSGNPDFHDDRNRSMTLDQIEPLIGLNPPHFVSLQKNNATDITRRGMFDAAPWLDDFAATAGLMTELDLVISVDTAVAHLAGAMGRPVWTLLPFCPDWRWMLEREDSPWYPTMRLFRQRDPQNWPSALDPAVSELKKFLAGDRAVLRPQIWTGEMPRQSSCALALPD